MRKMIFILSLSAFAACNSGKDTKVESMSSGDSTKMSNENISYPYTADYSSKFEMGDPKNAQTMLELYKDWDGNNLEDMKTKLADSVTFYFGDGTMMSGSRDTIIAQTKAYRSMFTTINSQLHAFMPLKSTDKNENWFLAWFKEYRTDTKGNKDSTEFQETWRLNKDGKADLMYQYQQNKPAPQKK